MAINDSYTQLTLLPTPKPAPRPQPAPKLYRPALPDDLVAAGWRLEYDSMGWCKALHDERGLVTSPHFPVPHRGLKFVLRDIERLSA